MIEIGLRELICDLENMQNLIKKLKTYNTEEERFEEHISLTREDARLAQRCVQSYVDILLSQKVKAGEY